MILFKPEHVAPIVEGFMVGPMRYFKTKTRRTGKRRWNVGAEHQFRTLMLDAKSTFAVRRIVAVEFEPLRGMTRADALAEGYPTVSEYLAAFERIYGYETYKRYLDEPLWVVEFDPPDVGEEIVEDDREGQLRAWRP